ncbi:cell cycle checkpoint [Epithele typhae]|uniref:cell cycle checkpoint n=1 Tax=Epithele typhae TaxID=378194 RepID=UPI002007BA00|nr:cell cycle checkpoint [Epithele typhae]KAH9940824.1 cell cycle checkpoint [Epithele typhae]
MRFRTNITNIETFIKIIQSVEKLQKRCTIKLCEQEIRVICNGDANEGGIQVWSSIKASSLFTDYRVQSNSSNEIVITLSSEALLAALRSAAGPGQESKNLFSGRDTKVVMKLAKNRDRESVLALDITSTNALGKTMTIVQQLVIDVAKHAEIERLREPMCPEPDVHILLPPLAKLRAVIDRLKPLANDGISFRANHSGDLQLSVSTDNARVEIAWTGLSNPPMTRDPAGQGQGSQASQAQSEEEKDPKQLHGVLVSHKALSRFLNSHVVSTTTIACICSGHCMILYVYIGSIADAGGVLTFYIPAQFDDKF